MSHTPTKYLIGSTECRGFYAYPTFWLLSSGIYYAVTDQDCEFIIYLMNYCYSLP